MIIEENGYRFDLVICDEAHKIRNSETAQHKGVVKIIDNSDAVVFLTATPIMTDIRNLFNLIRVLDRERYYSFENNYIYKIIIAHYISSAIFLLVIPILLIFSTEAFFSREEINNNTSLFICDLEKDPISGTGKFLFL